MRPLKNVEKGVESVNWRNRNRYRTFAVMDVPQRGREKRSKESSGVKNNLDARRKSQKQKNLYRAVHIILKYERMGSTVIFCFVFGLLMLMMMMMIMMIVLLLGMLGAAPLGRLQKTTWCSDRYLSVMIEDSVI